MIKTHMFMSKKNDNNWQKMKQGGKEYSNFFTFSFPLGVSVQILWDFVQVRAGGEDDQPLGRSHVHWMEVGEDQICLLWSHP